MQYRCRAAVSFVSRICHGVGVVLRNTMRNCIADIRPAEKERSRTCGQPPICQNASTSRSRPKVYLRGSLENYKASVAELADAQHSECCGSNPVEVRFLSLALNHADAESAAQDKSPIANSYRALLFCFLAINRSILASSARSQTNQHKCRECEQNTVWLRCDGVVSTTDGQLLRGANTHRDTMPRFWFGHGPCQ